MVWEEFWAAFHRAPTLRRAPAQHSGKGLLLFPERNGYPKKTHHAFSYSPLPDDASGIGGRFASPQRKLNASLVNATWPRCTNSALNCAQYARRRMSAPRSRAGSGEPTLCSMHCDWLSDHEAMRARPACVTRIARQSVGFRRHQPVVMSVGDLLQRRLADDPMCRSICRWTDCCLRSLAAAAPHGVAIADRRTGCRRVGQYADGGVQPASSGVRILSGPFLA